MTERKSRRFRISMDEKGRMGWKEMDNA